MEKISRVKKFESLRKNIETGIDENQNDKSSGSYAQEISSVNSALLKKMEIKEESYTPGREKVSAFDPMNIDAPVSDFQNEYLDDFINEVRDYNLKKGTRECENTQIDILSQLNNTNRMRRSQYVEEIKEEKKPSIEDTMNTMSNDEIAKEVKSLLEQPMEHIVDEKIITPLPLHNEEIDNQMKPFQEYTPKPLYRDTYEAKTEAITEEPLRPFESSEQAIKVEDEVAKPLPMREPMPVEEPRVEAKKPQEAAKPKKTHENENLQRKLVEETQQLRMQMDEYEEELTDLSDGVEKTNKMLNFILCILILALLVIIGVVVYWLIQAGGTI